MFKERRQVKIQEYLDKHQEVDVNDLASKFDVSVVTIRRDLNEMENKGLIRRTHGGAVNSDELMPSSFRKLLTRVNMQRVEKQLIGEYIASLIKPGETIYIGAGTTAYWVAKYVIGIKNLTIVTNSLPLANLIAQIESINLVMVGGSLRHKEFTFIGQFAEMTLKGLHFNRVIVGMSGIHPDFGFTSDYPQELMIDRVFYSVTENVIVAADHTKIGHIATYKTADIESVKTIVTTKKASAEMVKKIEQKGVEVILL
ncbi:MAG: DeoR/GlpR transcriptional regulator [Chloroflexi bacterium]|jgi:DeoR/GlpR family transcriptional regulator of sugar metabolism|nr:DeoR/GlpR transcriptional regulator [Chloroflexota bacterium]